MKQICSLVFVLCFCHVGFSQEKSFISLASLDSLNKHHDALLIDTTKRVEMVCEESEVKEMNGLLNVGEKEKCYRILYFEVERIDEHTDKITDTIYDENNPKHKWVYRPAIHNRFDSFSSKDDYCKERTIEEYERVCSVCLRHEKYSKVQYFDYIPYARSKFVALLNKIHDTKTK